MSLKISTVGDIMLGENTHHFKRGIPALFENRYSQLLDSKVISAINATDVLFANFECSFISDDKRSSASLSRAVYAAPETAIALFDSIAPRIILNVANNHFGQHGHEAANLTVSLLEKRGIVCIGRDRFPKTVSRNGKNLVCWGATLEKGSTHSVICFEATPDALFESMFWPDKNPDDFWIVSLHWGEEYRTQPEAWQRDLALELVDMGVDLILGHHPHVIQPVEMIGKSIVLFSQGNFIFDQNFSRITREGLLVRIDLDTSELETILVKQKKYIVHVQNTSKQWLSKYCRKNSSKFVQKKMRIAMKMELLIHIFHSNIETLHFFTKKAFKKVRG